MKILVINLIGKRLGRALIAISLVLIIILTTIIGVVTKGYGEKLMIEEADAIPYEKIIIIDAGHGGEDSGAVGVSGVLEKDLNLQIALEMGKVFELSAGWQIRYICRNRHGKWCGFPAVRQSC